MPARARPHGEVAARAKPGTPGRRTAPREAYPWPPPRSGAHCRRPPDRCREGAGAAAGSLRWGRTRAPKRSLGKATTGAASFAPDQLRRQTFAVLPSVYAVRAHLLAVFRCVRLLAFAGGAPAGRQRRRSRGCGRHRRRGGRPGAALPAHPTVHAAHQCGQWVFPMQPREVLPQPRKDPPGRGRPALRLHNSLPRQAGSRRLLCRVLCGSTGI